jgi:hypothetical protein
MQTEDADKMVELYGNSVTVTDISRSFDIPAYKVKRALQQRGVWQKKRRPRITQEDVERASTLYNSGLSAKAVGEILDFSEEAVRRGLKKWGGGTRSLSEAVRLAHPTTFNEHVFDEINPESAYWLGFCLGDASITRNDDRSIWRLRLKLASKDKKHIEKFKAFLGTPNKVSFSCNIRCGKEHQAYYLGVSSKHMIEVLESYHIVQNKTFKTKTHEKLLKNRDFARGLCDSDGYCTQTRDGRALLGLVGDYDVVSSFKDWASTYVDSKAAVIKHGTIFRYVVSRSKAKTLMEVLYQDDDVYYLDRKRKLAYELTGRTLPI